MSVYRVTATEDGNLQNDTAISTSGGLVHHQAEDIPEDLKARSHTGTPKAIHSRDELVDTDLVLIRDPDTGQTYETTWLAAKRTGLDAYAATGDRATKQGQAAARELPKGDLNKAGAKDAQVSDDSEIDSKAIYEPNLETVLISDTLAMHGGLSEKEVDGVVADFITQSVDDEELVGYFQDRGIDHRSLQGMIDKTWSSAQTQAKQELSPEDYSFLGYIADHDSKAREIIMLHGWKAQKGQAKITWSQLAASLRGRVGTA
nr:hypothetical protein [uncultured Cohaesibacter sp.]